MEGFGRAEWARYAELGWLGVALPEWAGGAGGGMTELAIVMAAAGRHMLLEPLLGTIVLGARAIEEAGTQTQRAMLLPLIATGRLILAFCHAEPGGGYARDYVHTIARAEGGDFVIDGEKSFALGAHAADTLIVSARLGSQAGRLGLFLVPRGADGVRLNVAPALDGRGGATVSLVGARLPGNTKIGAEIEAKFEAKIGDGEEDRLDMIDRLIDRGAIAACAE